MSMSCRYLTLAAFTFITIACGPLGGQPSANAVATGGADQAAINTALTLFKNKNAVAAETALFSSNINAPETSAWYFESGRRLLWLAASYRNRKDPENARAVALRAL